MSIVKVALLQIVPCGNDQAANRAKGDAFCRQAAAMGADIALFPEMWNIGYTPCEAWKDDSPEADVWRSPELWNGHTSADPERVRQEREQRAAWQAQAIGSDDPFVTHFRALAGELDIAIALTYLERWDGPPRNSVSLIDRHGEILLTYAKVHTCDFSSGEAACTSGDDFYVAALDTAQGEVKVGTMICYDREFPESARILMLKGAELILTPNACELERHRLAQFQTRACENMVGVAMTNYAAPQNNGHSIAFDGIAYDANGSREMLVIEAGESEGVYIAAFDMERLRDYRRRETWGNAFRKPHRYAALTSLEVQPPFIRTDPEGTMYDRTKR